MSIKSDKWIRRMSEEFGMIDPSSRTKSKKPTDSASSPTVRPATATISAAPMNLKFYQHQQHHRRSQNFDPKISLPSKTTAASSAQFLRTGAHGRIFPHSAQRPDRLFGQIHLRPLRHHRQRYPVRAGMEGYVTSSFPTPPLPAVPTQAKAWRKSSSSRATKCVKLHTKTATANTWDKPA